MKLLSYLSVATAAITSSAVTAITNNTSSLFYSTAVCDTKPTILKCDKPYSRLEIGVAVYGQIKNNNQCLKKNERKPKKSCVTSVIKNVIKLCNGHKKCTIKTSNLPNKCSKHGSKVLYTMSICRDQRRLLKMSRKQRLAILSSKTRKSKKYLEVVGLRRKRFRKLATKMFLRKMRRRMDSVEDPKKNDDNTEINNNNNNNDDDEDVSPNEVDGNENELEDDKAIADDIDRFLEEPDEKETKENKPEEQTKDEKKDDATKAIDDFVNANVIVNSKNSSKDQQSYNFYQPTGPIIINN